jgi:anti-sigma B factor antagonist
LALLNRSAWGGCRTRYGATVRKPNGDGPASEDELGQGPASEQVLQIDTARVVRPPAQALVVTVTGEIDQFTVQRLRAAIAAAFNELHDEEILIVDLTDVTFLGSPGLQALVDVTEAAHQRREPLRIVVDHNRPVLHPLRVTGLGELLALYYTIEQAVAHHRKHQ